jgi:hypothetical protein
MSSIRLSGTSSGYYDLTVPAVAGTNSIDLSNLPSKTNLGTSSITHGSNTGDTRFTLNSANQYTLRIQNAGNIAGQIGGGGADDLRFSNAAGATTMQIKDGRVTIPNQPAFKVNYNSRNATGTDRVISTANGDSFGSGRDEYNTGNHFNESTGRFTAPVTGTYVFNSTLMRNGNSGTVLENRIKKNGTVIWARAYAGAYTSSYQQSTIFTTTKMNAGDYVENFIQGSTSIYNDDSYFTGYLLG